jgi:hypothetical protein
MDIQYTWRTTYEGLGVRVTSEVVLKSESYVKLPVSRKNFIKIERYAVLSGNTLSAIALSGIYALTFMFITANKQMLVRR